MNAVLQRPERIKQEWLTDRQYEMASTACDRSYWTPTSVTSERTPSYRIRIGPNFFWFEMEPEKWVYPLLTRISEICSLPQGWDSYGARQIDPLVAEKAVSLLLELLSANDPMPSIVPTTGGGIMLEWHEGGIDLEVDVSTPDKTLVSFEENNQDEEFDCVDLSEIQAKLNELRSRLGIAIRIS